MKQNAGEQFVVRNKQVQELHIHLLGHRLPYLLARQL